MFLLIDVCGSHIVTLRQILSLASKLNQQEGGKLTSNEKELARMEQILNKSGWAEYGFKPYTGRTDDLDITSEPLFCPNCGSEKPLKVNSKQTAAYCTDTTYRDEFGDCCDYKYTLTAQRIENGTFWTSGFKYPNTRTQVLNQKLNAYTSEVKDISKLRNLAMKKFDNRRDELVKLIEEVKLELGAFCE